MPPSSIWRTSWWAPIPSPPSAFGSACSAPASSPRTRCTAAPSAPSTSPCGTSRARRWRCPCTGCSAARCATRSFAIRTPRGAASRNWWPTAKPRWPPAGASCAGICQPKTSKQAVSGGWTRGGRSQPQWKRRAPCGKPSAMRWRSASTSTRGSTPPAPSSCASAWRRCVRSSSRTRCARRTPPATALWRGTPPRPSPLANSGRRSGPSAKSLKRSWCATPASTCASSAVSPRR